MERKITKVNKNKRCLGSDLEMSMALVGVTLGTRSRLLATLASFKAEGEGVHRRALWCVWAGDTALTVLRGPWP